LPGRRVFWWRTVLPGCSMWWTCKFRHPTRGMLTTLLFFKLNNLYLTTLISSMYLSSVLNFKEVLPTGWLFIPFQSSGWFFFPCPLFLNLTYFECETQVKDLAIYFHSASMDKLYKFLSCTFYMVVPEIE